METAIIIAKSKARQLELSFKPNADDTPPIITISEFTFDGTLNERHIVIPFPVLNKLYTLEPMMVTITDISNIQYTFNLIPYTKRYDRVWCLSHMKTVPSSAVEHPVVEGSVSFGTSILLADHEKILIDNVVDGIRYHQNPNTDPDDATLWSLNLQWAEPIVLHPPEEWELKPRVTRQSIFDYGWTAKQKE